MKNIFLILHGYGLNPKFYSELKSVINEIYPEDLIIIPKLKLSIFSTTPPEEIVSSLIDTIDREWQKVVETHKKGEDLPNIIIIGHSTGALLARKLYVVACGENKDAPLDKIYTNNDKPKEWATSVKRIVLLAGMNRGWTINPYLYSMTSFLMRVGIFIGSIMKLFGKEPLAFKTRRGAPFITQLRIQWISMLKNSKDKMLGNIPVIQLLGTKDDIISPDDNIDILTGNNFIYLEVPDSDHLNVLKMKSGSSAIQRREVFQNAIKLPLFELQNKQILPLDNFVLNIDPTITDVVFVVHGIRDTGYWTQKIARRVKTIGDKENRKFATETSTYGYFAMLPFLLPFVRRQKVEWLMDQYTENLVLYPNAEFSFVGHSNGTYLLSKSLKEYPACKFKNVVFAGSVVNKNFEWRKMLNEKKIGKFYNLVASSDWVVAIFPKAFQTLKLQDLGSGGFDGFTEDMGHDYQLKFVKGGHGAAIEERYWDEIAYFIVHGNFQPSRKKIYIEKRSGFMHFLGAICPLPFLLIIAILLYILISIYNNNNGVEFIILVLLYLWVLKKIVTSF